MTLVALFKSREFVAVYLVFLVLALAVAWVAENPARIDEFTSISVLGTAATPTAYFPGNIANVSLNEVVHWNVQLYNHMGSTQLYLVRIKLGNFTTSYGPNATSNSPSQGPILLDTYRAVQENNTLTLPFQWSISNDTSLAGTTTIQAMTINNSVLNGIRVSSREGAGFRIVIELWTYDLQTHDFVFSFTSYGSLYSVFDQVWFNAT